MTIFPEVNLLARADHFTLGRKHKIDTIVLHATGGRDSEAWLRYTSNPPVSCHVLVTKAGVRKRIVNDWDTAWHAGFGVLSLANGPRVNVNARSLGIELENLNDGQDPYPVEQIEAAAYQVAAWHVAFPGVRVYRHAELDGRKVDPRGLYLEGFYRRVYHHICRLSKGSST